MKLNNFLKKYIYMILSLLFAVFYLSISRTGIYDWGKEIFYTQYIKESVFHFNSLPYYLWNNNGLGYFPILSQNSLFIGYAETLLFSPWIFFLSFLEPVAFIKLFYLIHLLLAIIGILLIARLFKWDSRQLRLFSGLFLLSPLVLQHLAIGYTPWINLYLFPLLMYFQFAKKRLASVAGSALVFSLIILQGGIHAALWLLVFIFFMKFWQFLVNKNFSAIPDFFGFLALSGLLSLPRIYSSFVAFYDFRQKSFPGFSLRSFMQMALKLPLFFFSKIDDIESYIEFYVDGVPYWDAGVYWGPFLIILFLLLVYLLLNSFKKANRSYDTHSLSILLSSLSLLFLSFGNLYSSIAGFLSRISGLAAFEGVEKYPFRFALVSFYGFSLWFVSVGLPIIQNFHIPLIRAAHKKISFYESVEVRKRFLIILTRIFCVFGFGLVTWLTWGKPILFNEISNAFYGRGLPFFENMMENKDILPVEVYLNKALTLSNWLVYSMGAIMAVCVLGYLYIKAFETVQKKHASPLLWIHERLPRIIEILIIVPLVIASLSWMRVAVATPLNTFERDLILEPEILVSSPKGAAVNILNITPANLEIKCDSPNDKACEIQIPIRNRELPFFEIIPHPIHQIGLGASLELTLQPNEPYRFQIRVNAFKISVFFTIFNWLWTSVLLISFFRKQGISE